MACYSVNIRKNNNNNKIYCNNKFLLYIVKTLK